MNMTTLVLIALRAAALGLALTGSKSADRLYTLADLIEAGKLTDDHMREVAERLKSRDITDADWDDVMARIDAASAALHSDPPT